MSWLPKHHVVVPVDFSDQSLAAVDTARELVEEAKHIHAIHVLPVLTVTEPGVIWDTVDDESRTHHAHEALEQRLSKHKGVNIRVTVGDPGHAIADFANDLPADLIVIPSHGRTGLERLLLGSVAERVLRLAHCPVLVIKQ